MNSTLLNIGIFIFAIVLMTAAALLRAFGATRLFSKMPRFFFPALIISFIILRIGWGMLTSTRVTPKPQIEKPQVVRSQAIPDYGRISGAGTSLVKVELEPGRHVFASTQTGSDWDSFTVKLLDQEQNSLATICDCTGTCQSTVRVDITAAGTHFIDVNSSGAGAWSVMWQIEP
jgi:hypothetical protein